MEQGLAPIYDQRTEILILGSAPSKISLQKQQYYGNKSNQFWKIIFQTLEVCDPLDYQERLQILQAHKIGLWDVYAAFERDGSMDHRFQQTKVNDFQQLQQLPLKKIIANGKKAFEEISKQQLFTDLVVVPCLSTSGANNSRAQQRLLEWQQALRE